MLGSSRGARMRATFAWARWKSSWVIGMHHLMERLTTLVTEFTENAQSYTEELCTSCSLAMKHYFFLVFLFHAFAYRDVAAVKTIKRKSPGRDSRSARVQ